MEFRINARVRLDFPVIQQGLCQYQRRQKSDGTAGARCLAQLDEQGQHAQECLIGGDRSKLHDVGCQIIQNACCEAGLKSQREVVLPALVTEKLTEPRVDVDASGLPGLPHKRLDFTVVGAEALHYSWAMRKAQETAPAAAQAERAKESKYGETKGGLGVRGIAVQLSGRSGPGLDALLRRPAGYKRAISKAAGRDGTATTGVAKTPERSASQKHRCDNPLGHRAQGLERSAESIALMVFSFRSGQNHSL